MGSGIDRQRSDSRVQCQMFRKMSGSIGLNSTRGEEILTTHSFIRPLKGIFRPIKGDLSSLPTENGPENSINFTTHGFLLGERQQIRLRVSHTTRLTTRRSQHFYSSSISSSKDQLLTRAGVDCWVRHSAFLPSQGAWQTRSAANNSHSNRVGACGAKSRTSCPLAEVLERQTN